MLSRELIIYESVVLMTDTGLVAQGCDLPQECAIVTLQKILTQYYYYHYLNLMYCVFHRLWAELKQNSMSFDDRILSRGPLQLGYHDLPSP